MINIYKATIIPSILILLSIFGLHWWLSYQASSPIKWADTVSNDTIMSSWGTFNDQITNTNIHNYDDFKSAISKGEYQILSIDEFLKLNVQNQRVERYINAKTAEEAYPLHDRPRREEDISSVNYFLKTKLAVSPITVARLHNTDGSLTYIKLDGVHRLMAALIKRSPVKILFIDVY